MPLSCYTSLRGRRRETHDDVDGGVSQQFVDNTDEISLTTSQMNLTINSSNASDGEDKETLVLFDFGQSELCKGKNGKKIKVQPNRKCKSGNCSHQAVGKERPVTLEVPRKKARQSHDLVRSVRENRSCSKESGYHVIQLKTKHISKQLGSTF